MKKIPIRRPPRAGMLLLAVLLAAGLLSACAGAGDWAFADLPGDYEIWRINGENISLVERTGESSADYVIGPYVCTVAWNEDCILVRQKPERDSPEEQSAYYLVTVSSKAAEGPFTYGELQALINERSIPLTDGDWVDVLQLKP